ncbi:MAG: hypothetical protein OXC44_02385 [Proteobacteria bacterium]|nr:hypothetical protein [Pseudomonadota bacterium]
MIVFLKKAQLLLSSQQTSSKFFCLSFNVTQRNAQYGCVTVSLIIGIVLALLVSKKPAYGQEGEASQSPTQNQVEPHVGVKPNIKANIKYISVLLTSNKEGFATISKDHTIKLSTNRTRVKFKTGWNSVYVHGPGVLPITYRFHLKDTQSTPIIFLAIKPYTGDSSAAYSEKPPLMSITPTHIRTPATMASACQKINTTIPGTQRIYSSCHFSNLAEEIFTIGPFLSAPTHEISPVVHAALKKYHFLHSSRRLTHEFLMAAENLHRLSVSGSHGFEAVSFNALLRGECHKVSELASDIEKLNITSPTLSTHLAICFEQAGDHKKAVSILTDAATNIDPQQREYAPLLYHLARIQMKSSIRESEPTLQTCAETFPWFVHCQKRQSDIAVAYGRVSKKDMIHTNIERFKKENIQSPVDEALKYLANNKPQQAKELLKNQSYVETSTALYTLLQYTESILNPGHSTSINQIYQSRSIDIESTKKVLDLIKQSNTHGNLYEASLHNVARDQGLEHLDIIDRLFSFYIAHNNCHKVLYNAIPRFKKTYKKNHYVDMMDKRAICFLKKEDMQSALATLTAMNKIAPNYWKTSSRIADYLAIKSNNLRAIGYLRTALTRNPPDEMVTIIKQKIIDLQSQKQEELSSADIDED